MFGLQTEVSSACTLCAAFRRLYYKVWESAFSKGLNCTDAPAQWHRVLFKHILLSLKDFQGLLLLLLDRLLYFLPSGAQVQMATSTEFLAECSLGNSEIKVKTP